MKVHRLGMALGAMVAAASMQAQTAQLDPGNQWAAMAKSDHEAMRTALEERYIYAVYPDPAAWRARFDPVIARAQRDADGVTSFAGYRAAPQSAVAAAS